VAAIEDENALALRAARPRHQSLETPTLVAAAAALSAHSSDAICAAQVATLNKAARWNPPQHATPASEAAELPWPPPAGALSLAIGAEKSQG
jgi:hypothetical protein